MARFVQKTATILAGQSLSSIIDCSTGSPVMVFMPQDWTPAHLSFQISTDGTSFNDLFDRNMLEIVVNVVAGTSVILDSAWTPILYLKIRSGSREFSVPQDADRSIVVTLDTRSA